MFKLFLGAWDLRSLHIGMTKGPHNGRLWWRPTERNGIGRRVLVRHGEGAVSARGAATDRGTDGPKLADIAGRATDPCQRVSPHGRARHRLSHVEGGDMGGLLPVEAFRSAARVCRMGKQAVLEGYDAVVAGIARRQLGDRRHPVCVVVAPGEDARATWRAQRRGVQVDVAHTVGGQGIEVRRLDRAAVAAQLTESRVVEVNRNPFRGRDRGGLVFTPSSDGARYSSSTSGGLADETVDFRLDVVCEQVARSTRYVPWIG